MMTPPLVLHRAQSFFQRLAGLMGRASLPPHEGLWIARCGSVHTCFMRFPIDVVFLDREHRILRIQAGLKPWRMAACRGARSVIELTAGEAARRGWQAGEQPLVQTQEPSV
jgi:uncharacterized membrane protein (UPF0127 family)